MILIFILMFCLLYIVRSRYKRSRCPNNYIRWDLKEKQMYKVVCFLCGIFGVLPCIVMYSMEKYIVMHVIYRTMDILFLYAFIIAPFIVLVGIYSGIRTIQCKIYFKRLEANGYLIPEVAKVYDYNLENLIVNSDKTEKDYVIDSKVHAILSGIGFVGSVIATLYYYLTWRGLVPDTCKFFMVFAFILDILWLFNVYLNYKRCDKTVYRDCTTKDDGRKVRKELVSGIGVFIVAVAVSIICISFANTTTQYVYKTNILRQEMN